MKTILKCLLVILACSLSGCDSTGDKDDGDGVLNFGLSSSVDYSSMSLSEIDDQIGSTQNAINYLVSARDLSLESLDSGTLTQAEEDSVRETIESLNKQIEVLEKNIDGLEAMK